MELDTEFRYSNVIDFFGTTFFHLCHFTRSDLFDYSAYNQYAENNIKQSDKLVSDEISKYLQNNDESHREDIICGYSLHDLLTSLFIVFCTGRQNHLNVQVTRGIKQGA